MNLKNKKNYKLVAILAGFLIFSAIIFGIIKTVTVKHGTIPPKATILDNKIAGQDAHQLALQKAKEWQADAVLSYMDSGQVGQSGKAIAWRLIFISPSIKNRGYEIKINEKQIFSAQEIDYVGKGEEFPVSTEITQEQAVKRVKTMPGYENAKILSVDAVYGPGTKTWYWGVKTNKGIVSIEMK